MNPTAIHTTETCPDCGEPLEEGSCWNQRCRVGFAHIQDELAAHDLRTYAIDAEYWIGHDR